MGDEVKGFTIILERDISEEMAERMKDAIELLPHVLEVRNIPIVASDYIQYTRAKNDIIQKIINNI